MCRSLAPPGGQDENPPSAETSGPSPQNVISKRYEKQMCVKK